MTRSLDSTPKQAGSAAQVTEQRQDVHVTLGLIRSNWKNIFLIALVAAALAGCYVLVRGKKYTSEGTLHIRANSTANLRANVSSLMGEDEDSRIETDVALIQNQALLLSVAQKMKLQDREDFLGSRSKYLHKSLDSLEVRDSVLKILSDNLSVHRQPRTELISISYRSSSPALSAQVVNAIMSEYIETTFQTRYQSTQQVVKWLDNQLDDLREQTEKQQGKLAGLQASLGVFSVDANHNLLTSEMEQLSSAAATTTAARLAAEARYRTLASISPDEIASGPTVLGTDAPITLLGSLRERKSEIESQLAEEKPVFGAKYPSVKRLQAELDELNKTIGAEEKRVLSQAQSALRASQISENEAHGSLDKMTKQVTDMHDKIVQYELLQQQVMSTRTLYQSLLTRLREAGIESGLEGAEIDIVGPAFVQFKPSSRGLTSTLAFGFVLGLFVGVAGTLIRATFSNEPKSLEDVQLLLGGAANFAILPLFDLVVEKQLKGGIGFKDSKLQTLKYPKSQFTESIHTLRSNLLLSRAGAPPKVILMTSALPGEGKTTVSTNLAAVLSRYNSKVVLVDCDMRRPAVRRLFDLPGYPGLTDYLAGNASLAEVSHAVEGVPNLTVITSGRIPPNPAELIDSVRFASAIEELKSQYDFVVLDSPPTLSVTDAPLLTRFADVVLLIVSQIGSNRRVLARVREMLEASRHGLDGFVLNRVDRAHELYYYGYYGHNKAYSYGNEPEKKS